MRLEFAPLPRRQPHPELMPETERHSPLDPPLPDRDGQQLTWGHLPQSATALALVQAARRHPGPLVVITPDTPTADRLESALRFFAGDDGLEVLGLPDWETLPYDLFSPHQDIVSQRLASLYHLPELKAGILLLPVSTLMQRLPPVPYVTGNALLLDCGARLDMDALRRRLADAGYRSVAQVMEHGEFAVRGALLDLFPMGSETPLRIDLFDDEIESIRAFDPETQRSGESLERIRLLPAREFPLTDDGIARFRQAWRVRFEGDPGRCPIYRDVGQGLAPGGLEYYLPLFSRRRRPCSTTCRRTRCSSVSTAAATRPRRSGTRSGHVMSNAVTTVNGRCSIRPTSISTPRPSTVS
jgi:transcription-repair coupling factor (superfamily II helicase)